MANISDIIESFLIDMLGESSSVSISRNELANYFSVAPSQINYVLTTRFTTARGYVIESRRGGGGFVNVVRIDDNKDELLNLLADIPISEGIPYTRTIQILSRLAETKIITEEEAKLLAAVMTDKALVAPAVVKDGLRAGMIRSLALELLKKPDKPAHDADFRSEED